MAFLSRSEELDIITNGKETKNKKNHKVCVATSVYVVDLDKKIRAV